MSLFLKVDFLIQKFEIFQNKICMMNTVDMVSGANITKPGELGIQDKQNDQYWIIIMT